MAEERPKLLIVSNAWPLPGGLVLDPALIAAALTNQFAVASTDLTDAVRQLRAGDVAAVLSAAGDFLPLKAGAPILASAAVINALGEGVCVADESGAILWGNAEFLSYPAVTQARISAACKQAIASSPNPASPVRQRFDIQGDSPAAITPAAPGAPSTDSTQWLPQRAYEVIVSPLNNPAAAAAAHTAPVRVVAVIRDVSALRRTQQKMAAIDRAGSELVRIDAEVVRKLRTTERLRVLEQKIVTYAHDLLNFDHFAIRLLEEKTGKLELVMSHGLPAEAMEVELFARREGNGISGHVAATGRSYICADTSLDPLYVVGAVSARSSLTVPLRLSDKVIGIFNVESTNPGAFTEEDRSFAEMFATHVALALHILDLLVVERCTTGQAVTGNVEGELSEPLEDIRVVAAKLKDALTKAITGAAPTAPSAPSAVTPIAPNTLDTGTVKQLERILADVDAIKRRVKDVASGPGTILGAEKALTDAALDPAIAGRRVLIADDDARIRQTIRQLLTALGAEVVLCENGGEAIAALTGLYIGGTNPASNAARPGQERGSAPAVSSAPASPSGPGSERSAGPSPQPTQPPPTPGRFDLLISDIKMPDKTGYEIFAAAKKVQPDLPVILMTGFGYDPHHSIVRASEEGLQCVLFKPFQAERLIEEVHKAMGTHATKRPQAPRA
jgi:CheY-like chemotaxis protein